MTRMQKRFLDCSGMTIEVAEQWARDLAETQRDVMFHLADLACYAESHWPDTHYQIWPEWVSPGLIQRAAGVGRAYPKEADRQHEATYTQFMQNAGREDRQSRLASIVQEGLTSDESRKADQAKHALDNLVRWLLAFDVHYFSHRTYHSGAGVETAMQVTEWVKRTVERLKQKGATDVLCAFEGVGSFRKELTASPEWAEHRYKDRPPKPSDLIHQLHLVRQLLEQFGFCCVSIDRHEADDVLASAAKQFPGRTTIISADKDLRQCLSDRCNILLDVEWTEDQTSGEHMPEYKWLTAKTHTEAKGITPGQWGSYQTIMGDNTDGIQGVAGVGEKGAADLVKMFGTAEACIAAAKTHDGRITPRQSSALMEFEGRLAITRQLVMLVDTLPIPSQTRI